MSPTYNVTIPQWRGEVEATDEDEAIQEGLQHAEEYADAQEIEEDDEEEDDDDTK